MPEINMASLVGGMVGSVTEQFLTLITQSEMEKKQIKQAGINLLRQLQSGDISIDRVRVTDEGWEVMPLPPEQPKAPTPNGAKLNPAGRDKEKAGV